MLWPENPANNNAKIMEWQRIRVPHAGRKFLLIKAPGASYATAGEIYTCSGYPNTADRWSSNDVSITSVDRGSCTFDRLSAWKYAEWKYVD